MSKSLAEQIRSLPRPRVSQHVHEGVAYLCGFESAQEKATELAEVADKERDILIFAATRAANLLRTMGVQPMADSKSQSEQVCAELIQALATHSK